MPKPAAIKIPARVRTRFLAHQPITRSITMRLPFLRGRLELAFGRDEEVARGHHDLTGLETGEHFEVVPCPGAELNLARRQATVAHVDEDHPALARRQHRALRHRKPLPEFDLELDVHEHPGLEISSRVGDLDAHLAGARLRLKSGRDERHAAMARTFV